MLEQFLKNCSRLNKLMKNCLVGGTPGRSRGGLSPEEKGAAEMMCDELTSAPMPMKFSLERREKWGKGFFYYLGLNLFTLL